MSVQKTEKSQRVTIRKLQERAKAGEKLVMLTCYDASFAKLSTRPGWTCCSSAIRSAW